MKRRSLFAVLFGVLLAPFAALKISGAHLFGIPKRVPSIPWNGYLRMSGAGSVRSKSLSAVLTFDKTGGLFIHLNDGGNSPARIGKDGRVVGGTLHFVCWCGDTIPSLPEDFDGLGWLEKAT